MKKEKIDYQNWNGQIIEENKAMDRKLAQNNATKINHDVGMCLKFDCSNRGKKCSECFRFSDYAVDGDK